MNKTGKTIKSVFEADKLQIEVFEMTKWSLAANAFHCQE
jgi:hypothetical protein